MDYLKVLIGIIFTFISYEAFPFISVFLMRKEYNEEQAEKMAKWNSIIVGFVYLILTAGLNQNIIWSPAPAILYYFINSSIWVTKEKKKKEKKETIKKENGWKRTLTFEKRKILKTTFIILMLIIFALGLLLGIANLEKRYKYYDYTLPNSKIVYTLNENNWEKEDIKIVGLVDDKEPTKIEVQAKYESSCGFLFVYETDAKEIFPYISSEEINDKLIDKTNIDKITDSISKLTNAEVTSQEKKAYKLKFIKIESILDETDNKNSNKPIYYREIEETLGENIASEYDKITQYVTINNGYIVVFQFNFKETSPKCEKEIKKVVKTIDGK